MDELVAWDYYLQEGEIRGMQQMLARQAQRRFGAQDEFALAALRQIRDMDRLDRLCDSIFSVGTWQDFLATP